MKPRQPTGPLETGASARSAVPLDDAAAALLSSARRIFETEGLPALSVRRVAEAAGCTTMQVYSRFGGKDGLLQALFEEGFEALAAAQQAVPLSLPPAERVRRLCREYLRIAAERPHHYALMLGARSGDFDPPAESRARALRTLTHLVDAVGSALPATPDRAQRARDVAQQILALCHGWATLSATRIVDGSRAVVVDEAVAALLGPQGPDRCTNPGHRP
ncbi:MAG: TetR/AcrR family transcriptional regulator [Burkholderiales bacterium]|nr:MAG: TetR/AcrR family transcriptional regulator [Burkholderiales bacterium]